MNIEYAHISSYSAASILPSSINPHPNPSLLLPHPHSPSYPFFSSSCLSAVIVIGCNSCFDAGFDRFVCGHIHSARIRKSTGRKMEICLQASRLALGVREQNEKKRKKRTAMFHAQQDIYTGAVLTLIKHTADRTFQSSDLQHCLVAYSSAGRFEKKKKIYPTFKINK